MRALRSSRKGPIRRSAAKTDGRVRGSSNSELSSLPLSPWSGLTRPPRLSASALPEQLVGRVKPDHGEWGGGVVLIRILDNSSWDAPPLITVKRPGEKPRDSPRDPIPFGQPLIERLTTPQRHLNPLSQLAELHAGPLPEESALCRHFACAFALALLPSSEHRSLHSVQERCERTAIYTSRGWVC